MTTVVLPYVPNTVISTVILLPFQTASSRMGDPEVDVLSGARCDEGRQRHHEPDVSL